MSDEDIQAQVLTYQSRSRAETVLYNAYDRKKRSEFLPDGFTPVTKKIDGNEFPCHPSDPSKWSSFPLGFRGCFYCGDTTHGFQNCPRKSESDAYNVFHWNLKCH